MTREEAIKRLKEYAQYSYGIWHDDEEDTKAFDMAIEALSAEAEPTVIRSRTLLPTKDFKEWAKRVRETNPNAVVIPCDAEVVSAEAVHGEWIDIDNYYRLATCSHCRKVTMFEKWGEYTKPYNFCPNCGADMRGDDNE